MVLQQGGRREVGGMGDGDVGVMKTAAYFPEGDMYAGGGYGGRSEVLYQHGPTAEGERGTEFYRNQ